MNDRDSETRQVSIVQHIEVMQRGQRTGSEEEAGMCWSVAALVELLAHMAGAL